MATETQQVDTFPRAYKIPEGPIAEKWETYKAKVNLVAPHNKRKFEVIVVGTGLAGASAAASLAELGYNVKAFSFHDSPRRAHSIAAQGGINAAKNYRNDGDSVYRLFYDTVKGGDFRARESNVHRLAEVSVNIIDQCVAQGVPFARDYGGTLDTRSFGGSQLSRTFYARGQTGQQLLLGAYSALSRQIGMGKVKMYNKTEMLDVVMVDGKCRGIVTRDLVSGKVESHHAHAVLLCTGGYGNVYFLSTNAKNSNCTAAWRAYKRGAYFANPCFVQVHPTCIPQSGDYQSKLTLMSESLRNDGRVWVPRTPGDKRRPSEIPEADRYYYLEERYPAFGNLVPRDVASRNAKDVCDKGMGVGNTGKAVYLDFYRNTLRYGDAKLAGMPEAKTMSEAEKDKLRFQFGTEVIKEKYGNLFDMYKQITGVDPYKEPMTIYPAVHYTMGGLWVDYELMTSIPGLYALGEANFSDHGANRLGASALMQGLADGYFVIPYTLGSYLAGEKADSLNPAEHPDFKRTEEEAKERIKRILSINGTRTVDDLHRELGAIMWDSCSISRDPAILKDALGKVKAVREKFWTDLKVLGTNEELNQSLEKALRLADFLELGELMIRDALHRDEGCGCHAHVNHIDDYGEPIRNDEEYFYVAAFEYKGDNAEPELHKEPLNYQVVKPSKRNYK